MPKIKGYKVLKEISPDADVRSAIHFSRIEIGSRLAVCAVAGKFYACRELVDEE